MLPSRASVTRFSGRGRSSVESQKSTACRATSRSVQDGANLVSPGFSPRNIGACDLPTIWMLPSGNSTSSLAEVEVVDPERLLEDRGVRLLRQREHGLAVVEHVVAPDLVGAVGQAVRVLSVADASSSLALFAAPQETTTRSAVNVSVWPPCSTTTPVTAVPAAFVSSRTASASVSSVTFGCSSAGRTPITSASDLACTRHGKPSQLSQRTHALNGMLASSSRIPHGAWNGCRPGACEVVGELLDPRLVADRRERVRRARRRLGRVLAARAVHLVELLGLRVVRLHLVVGDRPRRRDAVVVAQLAEVLGSRSR